MSRPRAVKIAIEFEDGVQVEQEFGRLPHPLQTELLCQPFASRPSRRPEADRFLLLEWEDGWTEVFRVGAECTKINRYYVISRAEDVGRLSLRTNGDYSELLEVQRRPRGLRAISFAGTFRPSQARREREGGKVDQHFTLEPAGDSFSRLRSLAADLVEAGDLSPAELSAAPESTRESVFRLLADRLGLRPGRNRQDVLDFVAHLLANSTSPELGSQGGRA